MPESLPSSSDLIALPSAPFLFCFGGCRVLLVFGFGFGFAPVSGSDGFAFFAAGVVGVSSFPPSVFFLLLGSASGASTPVIAVTSAG